MSTPTSTSTLSHDIDVGRVCKSLGSADLDTFPPARLQNSPLTVTISAGATEEEEVGVDAEDDDDFAPSTTLPRPLPFAKGFGWRGTARGTPYGTRARATPAAAVFAVRVLVSPGGEEWDTSLSWMRAAAPLFLMPATLTTEAKNSRFIGRPVLPAMAVFFIASCCCEAHEQRPQHAPNTEQWLIFLVRFVPEPKSWSRSYTNPSLASFSCFVLRASD